jgi:transcriptional regulator with XRE-family HTH domain
MHKGMKKSRYIDTGIQIRNYRKSIKMTLQELAKRTGISLTTLQRIETGKVSPSVVTLSEIAFHLKKPIVSFFQDDTNKVMHTKAEDLTVIKSRKLRMKIISPLGMINEDISVNVGEARRGKFVDAHKNEGWEFAHILKGSCLIFHGDSVISLNEGDSVWFDGGVEHYAKALSSLKWIGIYIAKKR